MKTPVSRFRPVTAAVLLFAFAAGCQLAGPPTVAQTSGPRPGEDPSAAAQGDDAAGPAPSELTPGPEATGPPSETAPGVPTRPTIGDCGAQDRRDIDAVIGGQLAAFADGDFAAALDFATPGFQRGFTPESFEATITDGFPIAASATSHQLVACQTAATDEVTVASVTVLVTGDGTNQTLQYGLQELPDGWRIDGAVPVSEGAAPVI